MRAMIRRGARGRRFGAVRVGCALLACAWVLSPREGLAFKQPGHDAIEAEAYRRLYDDPAPATGTTSSGRAVVCDLVARGFLRAPHGFDVQTCLGDTSPARAEALPPATSGDVDLDMVLQLGNGGQCYHFMAARIDEEYYKPQYFQPASDGFPFQLNYAALPRCLRLLDKLLDEALHTNDAGRRFTVTRQLIHSIGDSYSNAHTERGPNDSVKWLKVWDLVAEFDGAPRGPRTRHAGDDERDKYYVRKSVVGSTDCDPGRYANHLIPSDCFEMGVESSDGAPAIAAIVDFLRALDGLSRAPAQASPAASAPWVAFKAAHFSSAFAWSETRNQPGAQYLPNDDVAVPWAYGKCPPEDLGDRIQDPKCARRFEDLSTATFYFVGNTWSAHALDRAGWTLGVSGGFEWFFPKLGYYEGTALASLLPFFPALDPSIRVSAGEFDAQFMLRGTVGWLQVPLHPAFNVSFAPVYLQTFPTQKWLVDSGIEFVALDIIRVDGLGYTFRSFPFRAALSWGQASWSRATSQQPVADALAFGLTLGLGLDTGAY